MSQQAAPAPPRRPLPNSPCIGTCTIDEATSLCLGCARTGEEVAAWREAEPAYHAAVWAELPERAARLGLTFRRLGWEPPEILGFVAETLEQSRGTWVLGVPGAVGEVMCAPDEPLEIRRSDEEIEAITPRAALRLKAPRGTRAFEWQEAAQMPARIVLGLPRARLGAPDPAILTALGPDAEALLPGGKGQPRYDLGLGRAEARFTIRTERVALADLLDEATGRDWPAYLAEIGQAVMAANPVRVVETPLGRAEVATPIPAPGATSPPGPHTHLLPGVLASGQAHPPLLPMPPAFAAAAIFYPSG
ncbi:MAG: DUF1289 domain-containing protein [Pseudomonadota bacterium]